MKTKRVYDILLQVKNSDEPNDFRTVEMEGCRNYREGMARAKQLSAKCPFKGSREEDTIVNIELVCTQQILNQWGDVIEAEEIFYEEFTDGKHVGRYIPEQIHL